MAPCSERPSPGVVAFGSRRVIMRAARATPTVERGAAKESRMIEPIPRLGDVIDDFCPRCRLLLNHAVASLVNRQVVKVICQTCHSEHPYRHAEVPEKKKPSARAKLFMESLAKAAPGGAPVSPGLKRPASAPPGGKKKRAAAPARYISRHKTKPPRSRV